MPFLALKDFNAPSGKAGYLSFVAGQTVYALHSPAGIVLFNSREGPYLPDEETGGGQPIIVPLGSQEHAMVTSHRLTLLRGLNCEYDVM